MKVTFVSMVFPHPRRGVWPGIERHAGELSKALVKAGAEVNVLTTYWNGGEEQETWEGLTIHRVSDARQRSQTLDILDKATTEILVQGDLEKRLSKIVESAAELLGARGGKLYLKVPHEEKLRLRASMGIDPTKHAIGKIKPRMGGFFRYLGISTADRRRHCADVQCRNRLQQCKSVITGTSSFDSGFNRARCYPWIKCSWRQRHCRC